MKKYVLACLMFLIILLLCSMMLTGCGSDSSSTDSKTANAKKTPSELIIGKWSSDEGSIEFNSHGEAVVTENGERSQFTYKVTSEGNDGDEGSIKVSLMDSDKQSSSETITFQDDNKIKIGDKEFNRVDTANAGTNTGSGAGKSVPNSNNAIAIVKNLLGSGSSKYIYELDHEDQVIPDGKGNYYANRDEGSVSNGIDCYIVRVYTENKQGDNISQDNIGWYFVSKSTGKVYEMQDPYEQKLEPLN